MNERSPDLVDTKDADRLDAIGAVCRADGPSRLETVEPLAHAALFFALGVVWARAPAGDARLVAALAAACCAAVAWRRLARWFARDPSALRQVATCAAAIEDPRAIRRLLELADGVGPAHRDALLDAVGRLLPHADAATIDALTWSQLEVLRRMLTPGHAGPAFGPGMEERRAIAAVLDAMGRRGHYPARGEAAALLGSWRTVEVRDAARACLARLDEIEAAASRAGALLRPAEAPGETLLRPAEPAAEEHLLRAANVETARRPGCARPDEASHDG